MPYSRPYRTDALTSLTSAPALSRVTTAVPGLSGARLATWLLGFAPVLYLGLDGGGYDTVVHAQAGVAVWWILALGLLAGALATRPSRPALVALGALGAFALWSVLSGTWADDAERGLTEASRSVTLVGLLAVVAFGVPATRARTVLHGVLAGIAGVCALALLSRLMPSWFPDPETARFLPQQTARLAYPLNYWNAVAALAGMGTVLALGVMVAARTAWGRGLAAASVPVMVLTSYFTLSRGGWVALGAGLAVAFLATRGRLRWLALAAVPAFGTALVLVAAHDRQGVRDALTDATTRAAGEDLLVLVLIVAAGVGLVAAATSLIERAWVLPDGARSVGRAAARPWFSAALVVLALLAGGVAASQADLSDRWDTFTAPASVDNTTDRLASGSGNGRWQLWEVGWDGFEEQPLRGIGSGGYMSYWAEHATIGGTVRNAHNLYLETLTELGLIGGLLFAVFLFAALGGALWRARAVRTGESPALAGAAGAAAAFLAASAFDWDWQVTVLPVVLVLCLGAALATREVDTTPLAPAWRLARWGTAAWALPALAVLIVTLGGAAAVRDSQAAARDHDLDRALARTQDAAAIQPYASSPLLQQSLVLERQGRIAAAAAAAREATRKAPSDWRPYVSLARLEALRGRTDEALAAYRKARELNQASGFLGKGGRK